MQSLELEIQDGCSHDTQWLYQLFRDTNKAFIDAVWGWDELMQRESFMESLPGTRFRILKSNSANLGGYLLARKADHFWLEIILIKPEMQKNGYGEFLMDEIKNTSRQAKLPVKLSVLKLNPAKDFYLHQGFTIESDDGQSLKMICNPDS